MTRSAQELYDSARATLAEHRTAEGAARLSRAAAAGADTANLG